MSAETKNVVNIIKLLASGIIVILIALGIALLFNLGIVEYDNNNLTKQLQKVTLEHETAKKDALAINNKLMDEAEAASDAEQDQLHKELAWLTEKNKELIGALLPTPKETRSSTTSAPTSEKWEAYLAWQAAWEL